MALFQSTPPHGRRRKKPNLSDRKLQVSIHASAREATRPRFEYIPRLTFQSTPPHGRRPRREPPTRLPAMFQSTPPHGRRRKSLPLDYMDEEVSIHASAREATSQKGYHRSPMGFQSTPPHGRRPHSPADALAASTVSIHASAREATPSTSRSAHSIRVSIHASAREATVR